MTPERWQQVRAIFDAALEQPSASVEEFVRNACGEDEELYREIERMLRHHAQTAFLDHPPLGAAVAPGAATFHEGQIVAGRYRILRYISHGGMGEVYEARDLDLDLAETVALKTLLPEIAADEAMIARFKQEITLSRKVAHPNVCRVYDLARHEGDGARPVIFLTMEFLAGETLAERLREGAMSEADALPLLEQMAAALDASHEAGVIHRDFKPSNVMLVPSGDGFRAVVTDFGLARRFVASGAPTASMSKEVMGTLDYMAPELLTGSAATLASDIYALGMVAYRMATGTLPFAADTPLAGAVLRTKRAVPPPRVFKPGLDANWDRGIVRALDATPSKRFARARQFVEALRGDTASMTVRLPVFTRKRAMIAGMAALAIAAAVVTWRVAAIARHRLPKEAQVLYQQGTADIAAGAYFAATKALDEAAKLAPHAAQVRARLAEAWLEFDSPEKASQEMLHAQRDEELSDLSRVDRLRMEAINLAITHVYPEAAAKYEEMARLEPDSADIAVDLGRAYEDAEKTDDAVKSYRRAADGPEHNPAAWLRLGVIDALQLKKSESDKDFDEAERLYQNTSNLEGLGEVALRRGIATTARGDLEGGAAYLKTALDIANHAGNLQQEIAAKIRLSINAYLAGDAAAEERYASEALQTARSHQLEALAIRGLITLGGASRRKQNFAVAEQRYNEALDLGREAHSAHLIALSLVSLASLHDERSNHKQAAVEAREAMAFYEENHYTKESLQCLTIIARAQRDSGDDEAALQSFRSLLQTAETLQDHQLMALGHENIGTLLRRRDDYPEALEHYQKNLGLAASAEQQGYANLQCGDVLWRLGRNVEAAEMFTKADPVAEKFPRFRQQLLFSRAAMLLSRNLYREAAGKARDALASNTSLTAETEADFNEVLGLSLLREGNKREGLMKCARAWTLVENDSDHSEKLQGGSALLEAEFANGETDSALKVFHEMEPDLPGHPEMQWRVLALVSNVDSRYAARAREALTKISQLWGTSMYNGYLTRPDVERLSRPLFRLVPASH